MIHLHMLITDKWYDTPPYVNNRQMIWRTVYVNDEQKFVIHVYTVINDEHKFVIHLYTVVNDEHKFVIHLSMLMMKRSFDNCLSKMTNRRFDTSDHIFDEQNLVTQ